MNKIEPILQENKDRFVLFPIKHKEIWDIYKKIESNFWMIKDVCFDDDVKLIGELPKEETEFIKLVSVLLQDRFNKDFDKRFSCFLTYVQYPEARCMLGFQTMMFNVHAEVYSAYFNDFAKGYDLNVLNVDALVQKEKWLDANFNSQTDFSKKLIVYTATQRILYSSVFAGISKHIYRKDLFSPMILKFIYDDEAIFTDFALTLFFQLENKISVDEIYTILKEATEIEIKIIESFSSYYEKIGIDKDTIIKFSQYNANLIYNCICGELIYDVKKNPVPKLNWDRSYVKLDLYKSKYQVNSKILTLTEEF